MKFFDKNIDWKGRLIRGVWALLLLVGTVFGFFVNVWLGVLLAISCLFVSFEALRGWCLLRACGIKTKL